MADKTALFLVSTPLHFLVASSIALKAKDAYEAHVVFIDQREIKNNPYYLCEKLWAGSPFKTSDIISGVHGLGPVEKIKKRKLIFNQLEETIKQVGPSYIFSGNDRRIEFQYSMHLAAGLRQVEGIYMDEGMYTYIGRKESESFKDRVIDNYLKKLAYGFWWKNPVTIGGSEWVKEVYSAFPSLVHPRLKKKRIHKLDSDYFSNPEFKNLAFIVVKHFGIDQARLERLDYLITLPHESVMARVNNYGENIRKFIDYLTSNNFNIGVKYHPRNSASDVLDIGNNGNVWLIPDGAAYECFLPLLGNCVVIGDMSTTLLTTKWLRPDLKVLAIENVESSYFHQFRELFKSLEIGVFPVKEIMKQI